MTDGAERRAGDRLRGATTSEQSGAIVSESYERPKYREMEARKRAAMAARIGTALPEGAGQGRGSVNPSFNVSADDITVRVVDANGAPRGPTQQIQTKVAPAKPFGSGATGSW